VITWSNKEDPDGFGFLRTASFVDIVKGAFKRKSFCWGQCTSYSPF